MDDLKSDAIVKLYNGGDGTQTVAMMDHGMNEGGENEEAGDGEEEAGEEKMAETAEYQKHDTDMVSKPHSWFCTHGIHM